MSIKVEEKEIRKTRTKATVRTILELIKYIEVDDLIESLFIQTEDPITRKMLNGYEKQLLLAKLKPEEFARNLNVFYIDMAKYIKKNNLLKNFLLLYYEVFKSQHENALSENVLFKLYMSIIPQQLDYISSKENVVCGVESNGKAICIRDPYPYIDYPLFILNKAKKTVTMENIKKEYKKLGYEINNQDDIQMLFNEYTLIVNSVTILSFLIDENTVDMMSFNRIPLTYPIDVPVIDLNDDVLSYINRRNRFLKNGEVEVNLIAGELRKIVIKEVFLEDKLFLIYKLINNKGQSYTGMYDVKDDFFISPYSEYNDYLHLHNSIKELVLEVYIVCTTDIDKEETNFYRLNMEISSFVEKDVENIRKYYKKYNRDNLLLASAEVNSYIRKLPSGATASEEARENARKYGIELKPGETFVKSFEKIVYKKLTTKK